MFLEPPPDWFEISTRMRTSIVSILHSCFNPNLSNNCPSHHTAAGLPKMVVTVTKVCCEKKKGIFFFWGGGGGGEGVYAFAKLMVYDCHSSQGSFD